MAERRIDDHSFWAGSAEKGGVFPKEAKMKQMKSAEGEGSIRDYPDKEEEIYRDQEKGASKIRSHEQKSGYRY